MFYHLLIAVVGIVVLGVVWLGVQALLRRHSPELAAGSDVLACKMCGPAGSCHCGLRTLQGRRFVQNTGGSGRRIEDRDVHFEDNHEFKERDHG
ncbi:MAG: hypothetical protein OEN01_02450 [Candidatus Krumholzibacteria bacterium]|nr:hypothetical protein [Candidatus Krumholzibacteria bacterium]